VTSYTYDRAGDLDKITYPTGIITQYGYDSVRQVTSVVEKLGLTTRRVYGYTYDDAGNIVSESRQGVGFFHFRT
jgi:YD repeat-containing protein